MKLNPPNAHRSQIKICEKRQTRNVQFWFMPNAFRILKPIQKSSNAFECFVAQVQTHCKNQTRLAYEDKRDLYCMETLGYSSNDIKPYTRKHIRHKLEQEFGDSIHFTSCDNGRVMVYPDNLSIEVLVKENLQFRDTHMQLLQITRRSPDELNENYMKLPDSGFPSHISEQFI